MRDRGLDPLRQHQRDPVAAADAELAQGGGQAVGVGVERAVAEVGARAVLVLEADRHRVGPCARPARAAHLGDVEFAPARASESRRAARRSGRRPSRACGHARPSLAPVPLASERAPAIAADAPIGHHRRAHPPIEADRAFVPVEHAPFEAAAAARGGQPREVLEQGLADAAAALVGLDEEVFEVEPRPREEGREVGEEERERDHPAGALGDQRLGDRPRPEQVRRERLGRDLDQVGQLLELGQAVDQADDGIDVGRRGGADREVGAAARVHGGDSACGDSGIATARVGPHRALRLRAVAAPTGRRGAALT